MTSYIRVQQICTTRVKWLKKYESKFAWCGGWPRKEEGGGRMAAVGTAVAALQDAAAHRLLQVVQPGV